MLLCVVVSRVLLCPRGRHAVATYQPVRHAMPKGGPPDVCALVITSGRLPGTLALSVGIGADRMDRAGSRGRGSIHRDWGIPYGFNEAGEVDTSNRWGVPGRPRINRGFTDPICM